MNSITDLQKQELNRERIRVVKQIKDVKKREMIKPSVLDIRNVRRPRLERNLGRGGLLRRQKKSFLLGEKRRTLLKRKKILDILLKK